jgi:hypothetical protein
MIQLEVEQAIKDKLIEFENVRLRKKKTKYV